MTHRQLRAPLVWCWDNLNVHMLLELFDFAEDNKEWLTVFQMPSYAPELNPQEGIWSQLKGALANFAATLAAWQALDVGATERAWRHYEVGKRAAAEAKEPMYLAHTMAEQAYVLSAAGKSDLAVQLVQEAHRSVGGKASPRLTAWLHAAEVELLAQDGQPEACRRALDRAATALPAGDADRDPDMLSIFLNGNHLTRWRGNVLARLGDDAAISDLYNALAGMDSTFTRATADLHCDIAQAHLAREEQDQAMRHLRQARLLANRTGSARHRARIDQLSAKV